MMVKQKKVIKRSVVKELRGKFFQRILSRKDSWMSAVNLVIDTRVPWAMHNWSNSTNSANPEMTLSQIFMQDSRLCILFFFPLQ